MNFYRDRMGKNQKALLAKINQIESSINMMEFSLESIHALQMALQNEIDTVQIYEQMLKYIKDPQGRELLYRLIVEEHQHKQKIKEKIILAGGRISQIDFSTEVEYPNRQQILEMELDNCNVSELVNIALESEQINRDFYDIQLKRAQNKEVKEIFKWLLEQEELHIQNLKKEYSAYIS
jgi:rubrerythrin